MLPEKDRIRLLHMRDSAKEALEIAKGKTRNDMENNRLLNLSLVRLLEIVGEAASRVTSETRCAYPNIPWSQIVSLRNRLIHGYDAVDFAILWNIVHNELITLLEDLDCILAFK